MAGGSERAAYLKDEQRRRVALRVQGQGAGELRERGKEIDPGRERESAQVRATQIGADGLFGQKVVGAEGVSLGILCHPTLRVGHVEMTAPSPGAGSLEN